MLCAQGAVVPLVNLLKVFGVWNFCMLLFCLLCHYSPKAMYRFGRVLDLPKGLKERPSRGRL